MPFGVCSRVLPVFLLLGGLLYLTDINSSRPKISFVTTLHSFESRPPLCSPLHLQVVAMSNWLEIADEVIVLVDSDDVCIELKKFSRRIVCYKHNCLNLHFSKPAMSCLFFTAEWLARNNLVMYSNPDIIYDGVRVTAAAVIKQFPRFVVAGSRIDVDSVDICISRGSLSPDMVLAKRRTGRKHLSWAIDYYLYSKGSLPLASFPPYIIGNWRWDNWLLDEIIRYETAPVIDASRMIAAVHLGDTATALQNRSAAKYNNDFWYASAGMHRPDPMPAGLGDLQYAPYFVEAGFSGNIVVHLNHSALDAASPYQLQAAAAVAGL